MFVSSKWSFELGAELNEEIKSENNLIIKWTVQANERKYKRKVCFNKLGLSPMFPFSNPNSSQTKKLPIIRERNPWKSFTSIFNAKVNCILTFLYLKENIRVTKFASREEGIANIRDRRFEAFAPLS